MNTVKQEFAKQLREAMIRERYEAIPSVLEREFNLRCWGRSVSLHGVRRWLRGETLPTEDKLLVLAEWLKIEPQALRFGAKKISKIKESQQRWQEAIRHQEREVFEAFMALPPPQKKIVREVILAFAKTQRAVV